MSEHGPYEIRVSAKGKIHARLAFAYGNREPDLHPLPAYDFSYIPIDKRWGIPVAARSPNTVQWFVGEHASVWTDLFEIPSNSQIANAPFWSPDAMKLLVLSDPRRGTNAGHKQFVLRRDQNAGGTWRTLEQDTGPKGPAVSRVSFCSWQQDSRGFYLIYIDSDGTHWIGRWQEASQAMEFFQVPYSVQGIALCKVRETLVSFGESRRGLLEAHKDDPALAKEIENSHSLAGIQAIACLPGSSYLAVLCRPNGLLVRLSTRYRLVLFDLASSQVVDEVDGVAQPVLPFHRRVPIVFLSNNPTQG